MLKEPIKKHEFAPLFIPPATGTSRTVYPDKVLDINEWFKHIHKESEKLSKQTN